MGAGVSNMAGLGDMDCEHENIFLKLKLPSRNEIGESHRFLLYHYFRVSLQRTI